MATGWVVHCADWTTRPLPTREAAERTAEAITTRGACPLDHEVLSVVALQRKGAPMGTR